MNKKITPIIIAVVFVCVVAVFVYFAPSFLTPKTEPTEDTDIIAEVTEETEESVYATDDMTDASTEATEKQTEKEEATEQTEEIIEDETKSSNTGVNQTLTVKRVVDHTTNTDVKPRVVFGADFFENENYMKLDSSGNFEMSLTGYLSTTSKGTYYLYDDAIFVEFEDGKNAEYPVTMAGSDTINSVTVNFGDYDIIFN